MASGSGGGGGDGPRSKPLSVRAPASIRPPPRSTERPPSSVRNPPVSVRAPLSVRAPASVRARPPASSVRPPRTVRTFLALDFDAASVRRFESVGATLRSADEAPEDLAALRWTPRNNLHLTVKFLGDVAESVVAALAAQLPDLARAAGPIRIPLRGVVAFPSLRRAEVIVTDVADAQGHLAGLFTALEGLAATHGVPAEERPFRPHVTLARARQPFDARTWLGALAVLDGFEIACPTLALYRSDRLEHGAVYTAIARASLKV